MVACSLINNNFGLYILNNQVLPYKITYSIYVSMFNDKLFTQVDGVSFMSSHIR